ncbi:hypothetical protein AVEN_8071-1 [Araneus ventricosus]|uniref:Uncharacterized protein n=1 Tax=Araneus ventricosus TaxID=182803 RepID=A0A4Y2NDY6_ARAVE|nr:hypothetical protein AVEN_8071-1 [Araneus ventricosus]
MDQKRGGIWPLCFDSSSTRWSTGFLLEIQSSQAEILALLKAVECRYPPSLNSYSSRHKPASIQQQTKGHNSISRKKSSAVTPWSSPSTGVMGQRKPMLVAY